MPWNGTVSRRPLRIEQALDSLPELEELAPLREALIDSARTELDEAWAASSVYSTVGRRVAQPALVEEMLPEIVERLRVRTEKVLRHAVAAVAALEAGDLAAAASALIAAGEIEEGAWRLDQAHGYYLKAAELGRKPRDRRGEALALTRLGRIARTRGELAEALRLYREGFDLCEAARDVAGMVVACTGIGNVYVDQGNWAEAGSWYRRGMEHVRDRSSSEFLHLCNALSVIERRLGRLAESEEWLDLGERESSRAQDSPARGYLLHGRARLHLARGEVREAEALLRWMVEEEADPVARISGLTNLAEPLLLQGSTEEAEGVLREAEDLALRYRAVGHLAYVYEQMGNVARARKDPEGFIFFEQALDLVRHHRLPLAQQAGIQQAYGRFEGATGATESALARLSIARKCYRGIGAEVEATMVEADMNELEGRRGETERHPAEAEPE